MSDPNNMRLGLLQMRCVSDPERNLKKAIDLARDAASRGAQIVLLPELFRSEYFCQSENAATFDLAEPIPGKTTETLAAVARELGIVMVSSHFERRAPGLYHNTSAVFDADGALLGLYRKMHIPDDPLFYEKYYFAPGDLGYRSFGTRFGRVGVLVCWDQWYPEAARLTALTGAELLVYPTAIGWHPSEKALYGGAQHDAWETIQRSHAIANGIFVAAINRVGHEGAADGGIEFWGGSFVADPGGSIRAKGSVDREEILIVACDRTHSEWTRRNWPFLRDRRIDSYGDLTRRWIDPCPKERQ